MNPDTPTATSWVLVHHPDGDPRNADNWTFRAHDEGGGYKVIQVFHNNDAWQDKYANGYHSVAQARTLWDQLVAKGAKRWIK